MAATAENYYYIGVLLAVCSSIFIGTSFILKKLSLVRLCHRGGVRAGAGGYGYLKDCLWWCGICAMGLGELLNFGAYAFAPASLVTPLGALSVIVSAILASKFLNEKMNLMGKAGCLLCILGSTVIVIHAPKEVPVDSLEELISKLQEPIFLNYLVVVLLLCIVILLFIVPGYGNKYVIVYITLCSAVGSITVMACKAIGIALRTSDVLSMEPRLILWLVTFVAVLIICICIQMNYLNKSLDIFSTSVVTTIYYVFFSSLVITASCILFKEWETMTTGDVVGSVCGFLIIVQAIVILNVFK